MLCLEPIIRPLTKPPELLDNVDFEENSPHQEGIILETYINPDQTYFERPKS